MVLASDHQPGASVLASFLGSDKLAQSLLADVFLFASPVRFLIGTFLFYLCAPGTGLFPATSPADKSADGAGGFKLPRLLAMSSLLLVLAAGLVAFLRPAQASPIGAFITPPMLGTQVLYQNQTTGDITHSLCNSPNVTIFPTDPPRSLALPYPAKNGTSIAVLGWYDGASVWVCYILCQS